MPRMLRILVGLIALLMAFLGARWMLAPAGIAEELGVFLGDAVARNTARGDVGGLFVALALLCALGLRRGGGHWLVAAALVVACVAAGRLVGIALDGFTATAGVSAALEGGIVVVLLAASRPPQDAPARPRPPSDEPA